MKQAHPGYTQGQASERVYVTWGMKRYSIEGHDNKNVVIRVVEAGDGLQRGPWALMGKGGSPGAADGQKPVVDSGSAVSRVSAVPAWVLRPSPGLQKVNNSIQKETIA
ncbi:hypothetical protein KL918_001461 [Ogataea parapolymorpha]|nr:hypothetical protein KL918_001461 [Ogataea parapolymorpha]KAG7870545.1 hypothetical protein KL916_004887 [Ogataea parapolymorpha]